MKEKKGTIMNEVPDLLAPPHVIDTLIALFTSVRQADLFEQELLIAHLTTCSHCITAAIVLLSAEQKYEEAHLLPGSPLLTLLTDFACIHRELEAQNYEGIGAYAETCLTKGDEVAERCFPAIARHVNRCPVCRAALRDVVAFLREAEIEAKAESKAPG
jgi:hypothetical protein